MVAPWKSALGLVLLLIPAAASPTRDRNDGDDDPIVFENGEGGIELSKLIALASRSTGEPFFFDPSALKDVRVHFSERLAIPRAQLLPFVDGRLWDCDCVDLEHVVAGTHVHRVVNLGSPHRGAQALMTDARIVAPEELTGLADRWTLVTSWLTFRSIALAEGMEHSLCYRHSDSGNAAIVRIQGTPTYVVTGPAAGMAPEFDVMRRLDGAGIHSELDERNDSLTRRIAALEERVAELRAAAADRPAPSQH